MSCLSSRVAQWKAVFDSHARAHQDAGLRLLDIGRGLEDPHNVLFRFEVTSLEGARAFINDPGAAEVGKAAGVLDGELHFVESVEGYIAARG